MRWPWSKPDPTETATEPDLPQTLSPDPVVDPPAVPEPAQAPGPPWTSRIAEGSGLEVWVHPVGDAEAAVDLWLRCRADHGRTGLWPVLVDEAFWEAVELEPYLPTEATDPSSAQEWLTEVLWAGEDPLVNDLSHGPQPPLDFTEPGEDDLAFGVEGVTDLILVPAPAGWLVPELLGWDGAVNQDVMGAEHTAVLRRWSGNYDADLIGLTRDEVMLRVSSPPQDVPDALHAALEAVAYCNDAVFQGSETLEMLTPMMVAPLWRFWWD